ncbi:putative ribonuclease H-like domain-containing protein [Tanacetum coccineum]|uniref:Ribonuclease H-like domain-containing protein n=1 Tax=Tanacetum coccineum TaxID=301880 RepID=A0ABQ4XMD4_9ASTR
MYELHKAPRAWYGTLSKYLLDNGFQRGTIDQTLFIKKHKGEFLLVQVYVDDIIFGLSNPKLCREFEALMHDKFKMSAIDELSFFLGLQVLQKKDGIFLSQDKYVGDILKKFGFLDLRSANTPMDRENPWGKDGPDIDTRIRISQDMIKVYNIKETNSGSGLKLKGSKQSHIKVHFKGIIAKVQCQRFKYQRKHKGEFLLVQVYVDDIIFGSSNPKLCREFEAFMHDKFKMSVMVNLVYSGLQVLQRKEAYSFSQKHQVTPKECHLHAVKRIFSDYGGLLSREEVKLEDVSFWEEAASGCGQVLWIQNQLLDYGYEQVMKRPLCYINGGFGSNAGLKKRRELNILIKFNGKQRTISESSIRRHLKLNDEEGISTLPEKQLVENLSTVGLTIFCQNHDVLSKRVAGEHWEVYGGLEWFYVGGVGLGWEGRRVLLGGIACGVGLGDWHGGDGFQGWGWGLVVGGFAGCRLVVFGCEEGVGGVFGGGAVVRLAIWLGGGGVLLLASVVLGGSASCGGGAVDHELGMVGCCWPLGRVGLSMGRLVGGRDSPLLAIDFSKNISFSIRCFNPSSGPKLSDV